MLEQKVKCPCCDDYIVVSISGDKLSVSSVNENYDLELSEEDISEKFGIEFG